jgi:NTP pyrophosphatase (non-canonical NTP hydrolase)
MQLRDAQRAVKEFAERNGWEDKPNIDKFDHVHEELIEMSQYLRYMDEDGRKMSVEKNRVVFEDGIGDLMFSVLRLANQLGIDVEKAFETSRAEVERKYSGTGKETNIVPEKGKR